MLKLTAFRGGIKAGFLVNPTGFSLRTVRIGAGPAEICPVFDLEYPQQYIPALLAIAQKMAERGCKPKVSINQKNAYSRVKFSLKLDTDRKFIIDIHPLSADSLNFLGGDRVKLDLFSSFERVDNDSVEIIRYAYGLWNCFEVTFGKPDSPDDNSRLLRLRGTDLVSRPCHLRLCSSIIGRRSDDGFLV